MNGQEAISMLREVSDPGEDFIQDGNEVFLVRHGESHGVKFKAVSELGICVLGDDGSVQQTIVEYVQRDLLKLDHLAMQLNRYLERKRSGRPVAFIDAVVEVEGGIGESGGKGLGSSTLEGLIKERDPFSTTLIQMSADAGQGKTVLLEEISGNFIRGLSPRGELGQVVLPVDLLGRYVGDIDDAIAGTLNNTYSFPSLSQRDVVLCMKQNWIVLALDGFDELSSRVGLARAFGHLSDLFDQLDGSGVVLLSARKTYFDRFEVENAIRRYVNPRAGTYSTVRLRLDDWGPDQAAAVFESLQVADPMIATKELEEYFGSTGFMYNPFFLTRIAKIYKETGNFEGATAGDQFDRAKWVIDFYLKRENEDKWIDRHGNPLLSPEQHLCMLGVIAEEMWTSGTFKLKDEEVRIACELAASELGLNAEQTELVVDRSATHAALTIVSGMHSFIHEQFFSYSFGLRLAGHLESVEKSELRRVLSCQEVSDDVLGWTDWGFRGNIASAIGVLSELAIGGASDAVLMSNVGYLCGRVLSQVGDLRIPGMVVRGVRFMGESLAVSAVSDVMFVDCEFLSSDLSECRFSGCTFNSCKFAGVKVSVETFADECSMLGSSFDAVEFPGDVVSYDPIEITSKFSQLGVSLNDGQEVIAEVVDGEVLPDDWISVVVKFERLTQQKCDVDEYEFADRHGFVGSVVVNLGIDSGVLKKVDRPTSGGKKNLVRFQVDREEFLRARSTGVGDERCVDFWNGLRDVYLEQR